MEQILQKIKKYENLPEHGIQFGVKGNGFEGKVEIHQEQEEFYNIVFIQLGNAKNSFVSKLVKKIEGIHFDGLAWVLKQEINKWNK